MVPPTPLRPRGAFEGERLEMTTMNLVSLKLWRCYESFRRNCAGQDLIEYALMAGFVAVAVVGLSPLVATSFASIWSRVNSVATTAASS
jgi:Flp pilus assembly pilin Flp